MLNSNIAQKLIDRIVKKLDYNINIMDQKGIIIASRNRERIGNFHEIAYRIIQEKKEIQMISQEDTQFIGVQPGVNMPIVYKEHIVGVVGISGDPKEVLNLAHIVRLSVETMLEYELYKEELWKRKDQKNLFLSMLLYEQEIDSTEIGVLADRLGYQQHVMRTPILLKTLKNIDTKRVLQYLKASSMHTKQDISTVTRDKNIIIFKEVHIQNNQCIRQYKNSILTYIENINQILKSQNLLSHGCYFIGSPQSDFLTYKDSYAHVLWLAKYTNSKSEGIYFFSDYISEFLHSQIPLKTYYDIFTAFKDILDISTRHLFIETFEALYENNMNINNTAKALYLHRNTVLFRVNKFKELLGVDPINIMRDRQWVYQLLSFYKYLEQQI